MSRPLLLALLGASLTANAVLYVAAPRPAAGPTAASTPPTASPAGAPATPGTTTAAAPLPPTSSAATAPAAAEPPRGFIWTAPQTEEDFLRLAANLRAAGFPSHLVYSALTSLYRGQQMRHMPVAKVPYWQRNGAQVVKENEEFFRTLQTTTESLFGAIARPSERLDAAARERKYGNLPDAKIDALAAIERDYQEMKRDTLALNAERVATYSSEDWATRQKQDNLLESEKLSDLAQILTPAELAEYEMRNSRAGQAVARSVGNLTVTESEFAALFAARKTFEAANPVLAGRVTTEQMQQRQAAQTAYLEQAKAVLPDERYYTFLESADPNYRSFSRLRTDFPNVSATATYQAYQLHNEVQQSMRTLLQGKSTPETILATYADWNARLDATLGKAAADAFRKTPPGRLFNAPTMRPPATAPTAKPRG